MFKKLVFPKTLRKKTKELAKLNAIECLWRLNLHFLGILSNTASSSLLPAVQSSGDQLIHAVK